MYSSSLQRVELSYKALANNVQAIKDCIATDQAVVGSKVPLLSAVDDELMSTTLSARLMMNAEASQPWSTIGFDQWIGAGKWWLFRAQLDLHTIAEAEQTIPPAAYADLIKAGWILADVIPGHPQFPFISASKSSELQSLSAEVKNEFSRITALAMVVPALDELSSQELRLWESIPVKAPILRPYKVSQNLNGWRVDGGEYVLFRRFAFHELDSVTGSPCILLFLVHESAKAARLIAQDQYGDIVKAISFHEYVECGRDGESVTAGEEKFVLGHSLEAQVLYTMIETTNFYVLGRQAAHASLEDLRAYILLSAVKNQQEQAVVQILQGIRKTNNTVESFQKGHLARLAVSMASEWIEGRLLKDRSSFRSTMSLFIWAVIGSHTTLIEFLLSEDPVVDFNMRGFMDALHRSAIDGNEPALRWLLSHADGRAKIVSREVSHSLYDAIGTGREDIVALLIDKGADLSYAPDLSRETVTHRALRSPLSELVVHAILAMAYAIGSKTECNLQEAADRGHEGAIVLLSYAETMKRLDSPVYTSHLTHDSGYFKQVIAVLARMPNNIPTFDLTLMTVERRRTQVLLKVLTLPLSVDVRIYLDSYPAYIEDVPEGLSEIHKRTIKIDTSGEFLFTVIHEEKSFDFSISKTPLASQDDLYEEDNTRIQRIRLYTFEDRRLELPIEWN